MTAVLPKVLAAGLPSPVPRPAWPAAPPDPTTWTSLLATVRRHRLEGLLAAALADGLVVTEEQEAEALDAHRRAAVLAVQLEALLLEVVDDLEAADVDVRVLKGPAHAHLLYADAAWRGFGDVDLLVPGDRLGTAHAVLRRRGGSRRYPEPRPGFDARFGKGLAVTMPGGREIDLHRTLAPGPYGLTIRPDELFERPQPFELGGRRLAALALEDQVLHAAVHAVLGSARPNLVALRDLAQALVADARGDLHLDVARLLDQAAAWRIEAPVASAIRVATARLALPPVHELQRWASDRIPSRRDRRWLGAYEGASRSSARQSLLGLVAIAGWRDRAAYAVAMAIPSPAPGRASAATRWRRAGRALIGRRA